MEKHGFGVLFGSSPSGGRVTMTNNLLAHIVERNPLTRDREMVMVNNVIYNRGNFDVDLQSEKGIVTKNSVVGNVFLKGPNFNLKTKPIYMRTKGEFKLLAGGKVYVKDNYAPENGGNEVSSLVQFTGGDIIPNLLQTATVPTWNSGLNVRATANNAVYNSVLKYAGARPTDRDSVDKRIVRHVQERSGGVINCVANNGSTRCAKSAGGWPYYSQNTRKLTIPANPNTKASNGYTNLENWLHSLDNTLQGVNSADSPASPASLTVN
jgi:hypothetical protein